jgi:hypothetical protein
MTALGLMYLVAPELIEQLYGLAIPEQGHYGMHYAVGVRDFAYGLLIFTLTRQKQYQALRASVGIGLLLPIGDACIVLFSESAGLMAASPHLVGIVVLTLVYLYLHRRQ